MRFNDDRRAVRRQWTAACVVCLLMGVAPAARPEKSAVRLVPLEWQVVVNSGTTVPGDARTFNSFNQPSVNIDGLVVFRGRTRGGGAGGPAHGVYARDMALRNGAIAIFDRTTSVPYPNNLDAAFVEPPSFPRIDQWSATIASRGNHPPAWSYLLPDGSASRAGTTGIYANPFGALIAGAGTLGALPGFEFFAVPGSGALKFDVFPGAPAVTDEATIVFKANHTFGGVAHTGVYYRDLANAPAGGVQGVIPIASTHTTIPGSTTTFGSTAPPSAVRRQAVFAGFDNEANPSMGGIYLAHLNGPSPRLKALVRIGQAVPGEKNRAVFRRIGEGLSFDGRFVAFWAAWGDDTTTLVLQCRDEGSAERVAYCRQQHPAGYPVGVPRHQGIFVHDTKSGETMAVAKAPDRFDDFTYWNFSGRVPGTGSSDDDGELARWRSAAFVAVSGMVDDRLTDPRFHVAFKARTGEVVNGTYAEIVDGIYLGMGPTDSAIRTVVESGMDASQFDASAVDRLTGEPLLITEMGVERDGFRGRWLVINASMGAEDAGWAGIYLASVPQR